MELYRIEQLIEKYLEAETTLQEEKILKDFFLSEEVPPHLQEYKPMFNYFSDSKLEESTKTISLPEKKHRLQWLSVAAALLLMVSVYAIHQKNVREKQEAMIAYQETQKALNLISQTLNKGNRAIAQLETFEKTQNKVFKNK